MLKINEIFTSIQGEGPRTGQPATFIRLAGCNLKCSFCDTDHASFTEKTPQQIVEELSFGSPQLVVITGGEPLLQTIVGLVEQLLYAGHVVQIETNGTQFMGHAIFKEIEIVCSPKSGAPLHPSTKHFVSAWKYLIKADTELRENGTPIECPKPTNVSPVYYQPLDDGNLKENTNRAVRLCMDWDRRLSIQTHKILGVK